jgi:hypothetical protein
MEIGLYKNPWMADASRNCGDSAALHFSGLGEAQGIERSEQLLVQR